MYFNVNFLYIVLLAFFSLNIHSLDSSRGAFQVYCEPSASERYKAFVQLHGRIPNWKSELLRFAREEGERDAIRTFVANLPGEEVKVAFLRDLATNTNSTAVKKAAVPILAKYLHDQGKPECLQWYRKSVDAFKVDPDFRINFAHALLLLDLPSKSSLDEVWELLKNWVKEDMAQSQEDKMFLNSGFTLLFQGAKKMGHVDLVRSYVDWALANTSVDSLVRRVFITIFEGSPYINLIVKEKGILPVNLTLEQILTRENIRDLVVKIMQKNKEYDENVISVVTGNLSALLQEKKIRDIPLVIFKDFSCQTITQEQLILWAREIINTRRQALVDFRGTDIMLKTQFAELDNVTLQKYVVSAFKSMFGLD